MHSPAPGARCWDVEADGPFWSRVNELLGQDNPLGTRFPFLHNVIITNTCFFFFLLFLFLKLLLLLVQGIPCEGRREPTLAAGLWTGP